jgi:plasmid stability protein
MIRMPTLYIRNVPAVVYEALKARAKREGRSVNTEALKILEQVAEREKGRAAIERFLEICKGIERKPGGPTAAEIVRQMRDERSEYIARVIERRDK